MVRIIETNFSDFINRVKYKELILWGAGHRTQRICEYLEKAPSFIVDNDKKKQGTFSYAKAWKIPVVSSVFLEEYVTEHDKAEIALLITPTFFFAEILEELNMQDSFNGIDCYVMSYLIDNLSNIEFKFSEGEALIPKKIHYCWFGNSTLPDMFKKNIETWRRYNPDYEIIRWDETNYDVNKNLYMKQAYDAKKWGFVPDYARLDILYNEGGFYFDTDVEMVSSLDPLRQDSMFCAFFNEITIAIGAGVGAQKKHWMIRQMRDIYDNYTFINSEGNYNLIPCPYYQQLVLKKYGFKMINSYQKKDGVTVYPTGVLVSMDTTNRQRCTDKTIAIHHGSGTWHSKEQREGLNKNNSYM